MAVEKDIVVVLVDLDHRCMHNHGVVQSQVGTKHLVIEKLMTDVVTLGTRVPKVEEQANNREL